MAQAVKEIGAKSLVVSSDLGQSGNMTHADGIEAAIAAMKREGISDGDIDLMVRKNPARLGLSADPRLGGGPRARLRQKNRGPKTPIFR